MLKFLQRLAILCVCIISVANADTDLFIGKSQPIPAAIQQKMQSIAGQRNCPVALSDLVYLNLSYWGFDNKIHQGVLIVNKALAAETIAIFHQLFLHHFPIQQMQPMYLFNGNDEKSMEANNTTGYSCRAMLGNSDKLSKHAYGLAIDINPLMNPYVSGIYVLPKNATAYKNRNLMRLGMINQNSIVYQIFHKYGWSWGGNWRSRKDYQHFEKSARS